MGSSKFLAHISSLGCLHVVKATANPVMIGDMNVSEQELERRHTSPGDQGCKTHVRSLDGVHDRILDC